MQIHGSVTFPTSVLAYSVPCEIDFPFYSNRNAAEIITSKVFHQQIQSHTGHTANTTGDAKQHHIRPKENV